MPPGLGPANLVPENDFHRGGATGCTQLLVTARSQRPHGLLHTAYGRCNAATVAGQPAGGLPPLPAHRALAVEPIAFHGVLWPPAVALEAEKPWP